MNLKRVAILSSIPALAFLIVFQLVNRVFYPPPVYTMFVLLASSAMGGTFVAAALGAFIQSLLYSFSNLYVLGPRTGKAPRLLWLPSLMATLLLTGAFSTFALDAWNDGAGQRAVRALLMLNAAFLLAALGFALRRVLNSPVAGNERAVAWFNCLLHVAVIVFLFPYTGEGP